MAPTSSEAPAPDLWAHQSREIEDHWFSRSRALLWSMRTGKTRTIIRTADRLHRYGDLLGVLILAPNGVHTNWVRRELPKWAPPWDGAAVSWDSNKSREGNAAFRASVARLLRPEGLGDGIRWLSVNDEALLNPRCQELIQQFRLLCENRILVVADESTMFRRASADRTRIARGLCQKLWWRRILEGTALLNSPLHAFSQYELLEKGALGFENYGDFKKHHAVFVRKRERFTNRSYEQLDHYQNLDELRAKMARLSSVVMREDCNDMPELLRYPVEVTMSERQVKAYRQMAREMMLDLEDGGDFVEALNGGSKMIKLHQIVGGFVIDRNGEVVSVDDDPPILDAMEREVTGHGGKTIVWCRFKEDIRRVVARLEGLGRGVVQYHGDIGKSQREEAIDRFQRDPLVTDFVGQPQAGARGLDLSAADLIVWYSVVPDAIITEQGNERGTQMAGKSVNIATLATSNTVHDLIVASNEGKIEVADQVGGRGLRDLLRSQLQSL